MTLLITQSTDNPYRTGWAFSMEARSLAWVLDIFFRTYLYTKTDQHVQVDLGGSLAVASKGLFATGVSTDLNGMLPLLGLPMQG